MIQKEGRDLFSPDLEGERQRCACWLLVYLYPASCTDFLLEWGILRDCIRKIKGPKQSYDTWSAGGRNGSMIQVTNFKSDLIKENRSTLAAPLPTDHCMVLAERAQAFAQTRFLARTFVAVPFT